MAAMTLTTMFTSLHIPTRKLLNPLKFFPSSLPSLMCLSSSFAPHLPAARSHHRFHIRALDAVQPYDYEAHAHDQFQRSTKLKIAIVGFGNFGQFLAKTFVKQGHLVLAYSRSDHSEKAEQLGVSFFLELDDLCEAHPDVIIFSTSILSTQSVLESVPWNRLRRNTLFVDVLSVKFFPRKLFLKLLPHEFDILCTHPMFGPESGKDGWAKLPFVYDKVRIGEGQGRAERCQRFLNIFAQEGCAMTEMTCADHDRVAANSQFITHTVGRMLGKLSLQSTPINTKGYESLLELVENTAGDSYDLYYGLFLYNPNALEELEKLEMAFESVKQQLFEHLHDILRKQLFGAVEVD